jgi:superfamily II DNA helicase RecQ
MNSIDNELATLRNRIAQLEEMKRSPPPKSTVEELLKKMKESDKNNHWRKNESPVTTACRFMNKDNINILECIAESLNAIHSRIDALEKKDVVIPDEDVQLFNALKKKRMELANAAGVPAFCIATNRSLRSLIAIKPKTLEDLKTVFGFGPHKITVHGQQFLDVINPIQTCITLAC